MIGAIILFLLSVVCLVLLVGHFKFSDKKTTCWELKLAGEKYKVEFIRGLIKTRSKVLVNGQVQEDIEVVVDKKGADYYFTIKGYQCVILVRSLGKDLQLDLAVEGQSVIKGKSVDLISSVEDKELSFKSKLKDLGFELVSLIIVIGIVLGVDYLFFPADRFLFFTSQERVIFFSMIAIAFSRFVRSFFPQYK